MKGWLQAVVGHFQRASSAFFIHNLRLYLLWLSFHCEADLRGHGTWHLDPNCSLRLSASQAVLRDSKNERSLSRDFNCRVRHQQYRSGRSRIVTCDLSTFMVVVDDARGNVEGDQLARRHQERVSGSRSSSGPRIVSSWLYS